MLRFCLHSLLREYGWQFAWRVILPHPVRTVRALLRAGRIDASGGIAATCSGQPDENLGGPQSIVGVGFCLKPLDPPCVSGRPNHDCHYLENLPEDGSSAMPDCCRQCAIRHIGLLALRTGSAFYIMTSARDILFDLFSPALKDRRFTTGLFTLCRYSFEPFALGLLVSGIRGWMLPFETGDCRDYKTWLLADVGVKPEQTALAPRSHRTISRVLGGVAKRSPTPGRFHRRGNVFHSQQE